MPAGAPFKIFWKKVKKSLVTKIKVQYSQPKPNQPMEKLMIRNVLRKLGSARTALAVGVGIPFLIASSASAQGPSPSPASGGTVGSPVQNQVGATAAANSTGETERVVVTGSNIPTAESVGPAPVDTYTTADIEKTGAVTQTDLIQRLPAATGSSITENVTNGGDGRTEVNLRGIGPEETLVLVDGRRVAPVGFAGSTVDINTIPIALIDHIDILKDGASAIYGSDAVGGVFNIFLRKKYRGVEIEGRYGNTNLGASNDAATREGYILAGAGDDKTEIVVFAEYYDRAAIASRDRDISSNSNKLKFNGINGNSGNFAGRVAGFVLAPGVVQPTPHSAPNPAGSPDYVPYDNSGFNFAAFTSAIPAVDREYFYGSLTRDICEKYLTLFADFKYTRTFFDGVQAPTPFTPDPFEGQTYSAAGNLVLGASGITVPLNNPFNPFLVPNRFILPAGATPPPAGTELTAANAAGFGLIPAYGGVRYRSLEAGPRTDKIKTDNYQFTAGIRGEFLKTWSYEAGFRYNEDSRIERFGGIVNSNALRTDLLSTDPTTAFNAFGRNIQSNNAINDVYVASEHAGKTSLTLEDFKLSGDIVNIPAGPISFAVGADHRKETADDRPDALTASNQTIGSTNFQPTRGTRDVFGFYGEIRIPITSPSWNFPGAYSLEFDAAERGEYYSDFGDAEKPKFSVRWQPIDASLTLRATYSEAFHAPSLSSIFTSQAQSFPEIQDPAKNPTTNKSLTPENQVNELIGGNRNLGPENAYEWSYGIVYSPTFVKGLTLSVDYYHIDLRGIVGTLDPQFIVDRNYATATIDPVTGIPRGGVLGNQIQRDPTTGEVVLITNNNQNLSRIITEGIDYEVVYQLDTALFGAGDFGKVTFTLNATYLSRYEQQSSPAEKELDQTGNFNGATVGGNLTHNRGYASVFYDLGGLDTGVTVNYIGQYNDLTSATNSGNPRKVREWITVDLIASYEFNLAEPMAKSEVAGYSKDGGKNVKSKKEGKESKNVSAPVSTAEASACSWRTWVNGLKVTVGMNNVFDADPPFVAGSFENGYDEAAANIRGRYYYVSLRKKF